MKHKQEGTIQMLKRILDGAIDRGTGSGKGACPGVAAVARNAAPANDAAFYPLVTGFRLKPKRSRVKKRAKMCEIVLNSINRGQKGRLGEISRLTAWILGFDGLAKV